MEPILTSSELALQCCIPEHDIHILYIHVHVYISHYIHVCYSYATPYCSSSEIHFASASSAITTKCISNKSQ